MTPDKSILDRSFRYVPAAATDLAKTFERERKRLKALAEQKTAKVRRIGAKT